MRKVRHSSQWLVRESRGCWVSCMHMARARAPSASVPSQFVRSGFSFKHASARSVSATYHAHPSPSLHPLMSSSGGAHSPASIALCGRRYLYQSCAGRCLLIKYFAWWRLCGARHWHQRINYGTYLRQGCFIRPRSNRTLLPKASASSRRRVQ